MTIVDYFLHHERDCSEDGIMPLVSWTNCIDINTVKSYKSGERKKKEIKKTLKKKTKTVAGNDHQSLMVENQTGQSNRPQRTEDRK